jgi:3-hydroxyacyl-[acyl-carrier-protein] dehydratase
MSPWIRNCLKRNNMLRGILYETVQADAGGATVRLLPESPVYRGHFPGYPITPGVCLVQMALELIGEMADQVGHDGVKDGHDGVKDGHDGRVRLVAAKNIKFMAPVIPAEGMLLRFNLSGEAGEWSVEIWNGDVLSAKMSLTVA